MQELADKIVELLENKKVIMLDDYFENIFMDRNHKEFFRARHPRLIKTDEENKQVMNDIINKLEKI